ncbi:MAG: hypothetical protein FIA97_12425 [Methylococcaceae bacterium]|nr:hypothetical protein [Methylococcaceae bacterium]
MKARTAVANQTRGLLSEYGIVIAQGLSQVRKRLPEILKDAENGLSASARASFSDGYNRLVDLDRQIKGTRTKSKRSIAAARVGRNSSLIAYCDEWKRTTAMKSEE